MTYEGGRNPMDAEAKVQLVRMEGKIDLINERHARNQKDMGEMKERQASDMKTVNERLHGHGNRLGVLEADRHLRAGERQGVAISAKAINWLFVGGGAGIVAIVAVVARQAGI